MIDLRDENHIDKSIDPFSILINQSYGDVLFDILEFLPKKYYEDYFKALSLLQDYDFHTASTKLGFIGESFSHEAIFGFILTRMKGVKGIGKPRDHLSKSKDWNSRINTLKLIQDNCSILTDIEKECLDTMYHGFHLFRILRNRAHHPNKVFLDVQAETMLTLLIYLQIELYEFLKK